MVVEKQRFLYGSDVAAPTILFPTFPHKNRSFLHFPRLLAKCSLTPFYLILHHGGGAQSGAQNQRSSYLSELASLGSAPRSIREIFTGQCFCVISAPRIHSHHIVTHCFMALTIASTSSMVFSTPNDMRIVPWATSSGLLTTRTVRFVVSIFLAFPLHAEASILSHIWRNLLRRRCFYETR